MQLNAPESERAAYGEVVSAFHVELRHLLTAFFSSGDFRIRYRASNSRQMWLLIENTNH